MKKIRIPKQKRSIETKTRIKEAALSLFAEKGIHNTNSNEIALEAGTAIGSFYAYFSNKKSLLLELLEDYLEDHFATIWGRSMDEMAAPKTQLKDFIRTNLKNLFVAYSKLPTFHKETHILRYSDPDVKRLFDKDRTKEILQIKALFEIFKEEVTVSDPDAAALLIQCTAENVAHAVKFGGTDIDEDRLINELSDMFYRYLTGTG
jgi:AcrR family transcriptional regulator